MKNFIDVYLEVGNDMKEKFEKGEQIRYKHYLTEENKAIFHSLNKVNSENEINQLNSNIDHEILMYFVRFIVDLSYIDSNNYKDVLNWYATHCTNIVKISQTIFKDFNHEFENAKKTKEVESFIQYINNNYSSVMFAVKNSFSSSRIKLDTLKKIDTNHQLMSIQNKIKSSYNRKTFEL